MPTTQTPRGRRPDRGTGAAPPVVPPAVPTRRPRALLAAAALRAVPVLMAVPVLAACAAPAQDEGYATVHSLQAGASVYKGTPIDDAYTLPAATWKDTAGTTVHWPADGLPEPVTVVFFAYTNCPDVCSTQLADMTAAIRGLDPALRDRTTLVMVTVDPERDDAATLASFLDRFDATLPVKYVGLRSDDSAMLVKAAEGLGVALTGSEDTAHGYEVGHGAQLIGFGPDGTAPVIWLPGTAVGDMRADLVTLAAQG